MPAPPSSVDTFGPLPRYAAWCRLGDDGGAEFVHLVQPASGTAAVTRSGTNGSGPPPGGYRGCLLSTTAPHLGILDYRIDVDRHGRTRRVLLVHDGVRRATSRELEHDGDGNWRVDGTPAPALGGCLDVDLEGSAFTNTLLIRRLRLSTSGSAEPPAAYVRADGLEVERLHQRYTHARTDADARHYVYEAPDFDFSCEIEVDGCGLVTRYPGLAVRVG